MENLGKKTDLEAGRRNIKIGGMALENGVLFQTDRFWAMAVRRPDGSIEVTSGKKTSLNRSSRLRKIPLLRGLVNLAESIVILPDAHAFGGQLPMLLNSPHVLTSMLVSTLGSIALKNPKKKLSPLVEELAMAGLALLPSLVALRQSRATQYHAAEHKSINAYETTGAIGHQEAQSARPDHPRCGSNIVGPALVLMAVGNTLARRALGRQSRAARLGIGILSLSGALEMIQWASRHPRSRWSKILTYSGSGLQNLITTSEPTEEQLEVSLAALRQLLRLEGVL